MGIKLCNKPLVNRIPCLIILSGILFSFYLQWQIPEGTFFSGDAWLKALLAKQLSSGNFQFNLDLPAEVWVNELWEKGLYPFEPPFVYNQSGRYFITFPFTFPLITAPLHALFGWRGLYIIPLVSSWAIWIVFYRVCQRLALGVFPTSVALFALIFSSPLTLYSAIYWEHSVAVLLAFQGLTIILAPESINLSRKEAILSGVLIGLSVWFRPEFLCLVGIILLFAIFSSSIAKKLAELLLFSSGAAISLSLFLKDGSIRFIAWLFLLAYISSKIRFSLDKKIFLVTSIALTLLIFFGLNIVIYHHPLGIHAIQVVDDFSPRVRIYQALTFFNSMNEKLLYYFPVIFFAIIYSLLSVFSKDIKLTDKMKFLLIICILFVYSTPILLPSDGGKQWGPRFWLFLTPLVCLLSAMALQHIMQFFRPPIYFASISVLAMLLAIGIHINIYQGSLLISQNTYSSLHGFLQSDSNRIVAVSHQYLSQELSGHLDQKILFLTKSDDELVKLSQALSQQGYNRFTYICYRDSECVSSRSDIKTFEFPKDGQTLGIRLTELERYSQNSLDSSYQIAIVEIVGRDSIQSIRGQHPRLNRSDFNFVALNT